MPPINKSGVFYPPQFPLQGRLPRRPDMVQQNLRCRRRQEADHHNALCIAAGRRIPAPCCKTVHITLCFDGTGNNLNSDLYESGNSPHPTNIARMFRASIGDGYAGGTAHTERARRLIDAPGTGLGEFYKYYMPGVGTPFPEIGDLDYTDYGMAFAGYGEERINWALLMIIDALRRVLNMPRQDTATLLDCVSCMGTPRGMEAVFGAPSRRREFYKQFAALEKPLRRALTALDGQCRLLGLKLYVYGFSRGAAAARAFVSWLNELLSGSEARPSLKVLDVALPIDVEYLGLLDTVASVGMADISQVAEGHMSWADSNQQLPESGLVKRCLHLVASHEQRLCFPLESIRRDDGSYPANSVEVIYPGVHSDQGGGYPPGDQGKAIGESSATGDSLLLSQIALHDLYADAFVHGAPLKVPPLSLPKIMDRDLWRAMEAELQEEFEVSPTLIARFNAWRQVTLGLIPDSQPLPNEQAERYQPLSATVSLEKALSDQLAWITAWRIDRYAFASLKHAPFYLQASDTHADKAARNSASAERDKKQKEIEAHRRMQLAQERMGSIPRKPMKPGIKDFDPDLAQTQLRETAEEFGNDYRAGLAVTLVIWAASAALPGMVAGARIDRLKMRDAAKARVRRLFPQPKGEYDHVDDNRRGNVDENRNAHEPEGLLRALFDDQVHDSRAWFLHAALGTREPMGSYLSERMVFFGETNSRKLALFDENEQPILAGDPRLIEVERPGSAPPPIISAERRAQARRKMEALWHAYDANVARGDDGLV